VLPTRNEPLGLDHRGREYWYFVHDATRLYVRASSPPMTASSSRLSVDASPSTGWGWAYYDTLVSVRELYSSLDGAGASADERALKSVLKERMPLFEIWMETDQVVNLEEGWREDGHQYEGKQLLRGGQEGWVVNTTCKVTRWLPPKEAKLDESGTVIEAAEGALYHVVHDDGDEEDLDEDEVEAVGSIKTFKGKTVAKSRLSEDSNHSIVPKKNQRRTLADFKKHLAGMGITDDVDGVAERVRSRSRSRSRVSGEKRGRSETRERSTSRGRSMTPSRNDRSLTSAKKPKLLEAAVAQMKKAQKKIAKMAISESDRKIPDKKPKWQFTGKMDVRKTHNKR